MNSVASNLIDPQGVPAAVEPAPLFDAGVHIGWRSTRAGVVQLEAEPFHRIRIAQQPVGGYCGEMKFLYTRGDMDIMPAGYTDTWREDVDNTSLYLALAPDLLQRTAAELGIDSARAQLDQRHQFRDAQIEHIAWALDAERRSGFENGALYAQSIGTALAVHLLRRYPATAIRGGGLAPARLRRLQEYIESHLEQPLTLQELAAIAGISASHLKTQFRTSTGLPVHQYVMRRRVERAGDLLQRTDLALSDIALSAGFSHQSHMARCMRSLLGVLPSALRRART